MFILYGITNHAQWVGTTTIACAKCQSATDLFRVYRVVHVFFVPLFSPSESFERQCSGCGAVVVAERPPGAVVPKPFMHRLGFLVVLGFVVFVPCMACGFFGMLAAVAKAVTRWHLL